MRNLILIIMLFIIQSSFAIEKDTIQLDFEEYLAIVKKYHPLVKQAGLKVEEGNFKLLKARGSFDPKVEADFTEKDYKNTEYYNLFGAAFKIPTYYGLEFKATYEENSGKYLNPQNTVPEEGLYSAGVSLDVTNGIFMSERMATLKQAKIYQEQAQVKQDLMIAEILYEASNAYFEWYAAYEELRLYKNLVANAEFRLKSVKTQHQVGDKPAIDTLEANITFENRELLMQQAELDYLKSSLKLSNYLWAENSIPLEITSEVRPMQELFEKVTSMWLENELGITENIAENPKVRFLEYNLEMIKIEKKFKANKLLPNLDLSYNFLQSQPEEWRRINTSDYKFGFKFSLPLFLRKERGDLQLAKLELENSRFELIQTTLEIQNKLKILQNEIVSYRDQRFKLNNIIGDYAILVNAEQRMFELGDSSLFLVNSRENSYISARLKEISLIKKYLKSQAELLKIKAVF